MKKDKKIKTLHLRSSAGFYGAEQVIVTLLSQLKNSETECHLAIFNNYLNANTDLIDRAKKEGIQVIELPSKGRMDLSTFIALMRVIRSGEYDVLHTHDYKSAFYGLLPAKIAGVKLLATLHGWLQNNRAEKLYKIVELAILRMYDLITVVSSDQKQELLDRGFSPKKVRQLDNGVDIQKYRPAGITDMRNRLNIRDGQIVIGTVARMTKEKGHKVLLDAFQILTKKHRNLTLLLVGDGDLREKLEREVRQNGLQDQVIFTGTRDDVPDLYRIMDIYINSSLTEGMPMSILEAMASGLPVVASDVGEIGRLINESGAGTVVPPSNVEALVLAVDEFLQGNQGNLREQGERSREYIEKQFTDTHQAVFVQNLYKEII